MLTVDCIIDCSCREYKKAWCESRGGKVRMAESHVTLLLMPALLLLLFDNAKRCQCLSIVVCWWWENCNVVWMPTRRQWGRLVEMERAMRVWMVAWSWWMIFLGCINYYLYWCYSMEDKIMNVKWAFFVGVLEIDKDCSVIKYFMIFHGVTTARNTYTCIWATGVT